jgi:VanZ family protein
MGAMLIKTWSRSFLGRWGPALLIMAAIFFFSSIPSSGMPSFGSFDIPLKKGGHMLGYFLLGAAYLHGLGNHTKGAYGKAWLLAVIYAISDEIHQAFVPGRGPWVVDVSIDAAGAFLGLVIAHLRWKYSPRPIRQTPDQTLHSHPTLQPAPGQSPRKGSPGGPGSGAV